MRIRLFIIVIITRNRRERYWRHYEFAKNIEKPSLRSMLLELSQKKPWPRKE